ncbi:MAG: valine--tRNA ligase [Gammaproteobacteria bacterium]|nr:valine--tRNA ligase [Gammaproteobacteria bacterium]
MDKTYDPHTIESRWYARWEERGWFRPAGDGPPYCIMLPPPNVTGSLHMGHAFQDTLMDALSRYQRMHARRTLWQGGTDHAGIATQMVVERQLAARGQSRHDLGREAFVAEVWRWKEQSGGMITRQLRRMGASLDWSRERFTLDEGLSRAVTEVFVRLYEEGLIYRGQRLVNWDPVLHTAISDLEVVAEEEQGSLWHIRYPCSDGDGSVVVATTRPETMLGDAAVAVHPHDARYRTLLGRTVVLPLTGREIPVIADEYVDPAFGSGCVKITPAHDFNDYAVWQRHKDQHCFTSQPCGGLINIFTADAAIGDNGAQAYRGLDRYEARRRIVADLEAAGLIERVEPHKLMVPRGDRSHAVIEPYLTDQWYVRAAPLAEPAIAAVEDGRIRFVPESWAKTYFDWMRRIEDWCISRQLWWGHRIPAWYDTHGNVYVGASEAAVRARHGLAGDVQLEQDPDVLDTWFSSALWPFSTLGWPDETPELATFYPTSVLVTGFDIIFFWVARMIMMGMKFMGAVPFREVYIHGLVRDQDGQKMSKSKGNILDPIDLIDGIDPEALVAKRTSGLMRPQDAPKIAAATRRQFPQGIAGYGTDALRFTFAALASPGRNINFDLGRIEGYRNFCNKLWNAARFVLQMVEGAPVAATPGTSLADRWVASRLDVTVGAVTSAFAGYRFDLAAQAIYTFVWEEYCDWYIEYAKAVLNDPAADELRKAGTRAALVQNLETVLRLAHPLMPFITEEIWQRVAPLARASGETISLAAYPHTVAHHRDEQAVVQFGWLQQFVLGVRRIRAEMDIAPGRALPLLVRGGSPAERDWLEHNRAELTALARLSAITAHEAGEPPEAATALAGDMTLLVPLADLIDPVAECARLDKEIEKLDAELLRVRGKLANENFVSRAPAEVVARERARLLQIEDAHSRLGAQRIRIAALRAPR